MLIKLVALIAVLFSNVADSKQILTTTEAGKLCTGVLAAPPNGFQNIEIYRFNCRKYLDAISSETSPRSTEFYNLASFASEFSKDTALKIIDEGLLIHKNNPSLRTIKMYIHSRFGDIEKARDEHDVFVQTESRLEIGEAQSTIGRRLFRENSYTVAVEFLSHALDRSRSNAELHLERNTLRLRGEALKRLGRFREALIDFEELSQMSSDSSYDFYIVCLIRFELGELKQALKACDSAATGEHFSKVSKTMVLNTAVAIAAADENSNLARQYHQECLQLYPEDFDKEPLVSRAQKFQWGDLPVGPPPRCELPNLNTEDL